LVQASVIDKDLTTPPMSPGEGDCYIVAATGTGAWVGWDNRIARYIDGEWRSYLPGAGAGEGWLVYVQDEDALYVFTGSAWQSAVVALNTLADKVQELINSGADADELQAFVDTLRANDAAVSEAIRARTAAVNEPAPVPVEPQVQPEE
jgi:hypothetical protein